MQPHPKTLTSLHHMMLELTHSKMPRKGDIALIWIARRKSMELCTIVSAQRSKVRINNGHIKGKAINPRTGRVFGFSGDELTGVLVRTRSRHPGDKSGMLEFPLSVSEHLHPDRVYPDQVKALAALGFHRAERPMAKAA